MLPTTSTAAESGDPLLTLLDQHGIGRSSVIRVTGPGGLFVLLWLCRHGFEQVGYLRSDQSGPNEEPDALLVARTCDATWLERLLTSGPHVRDGGVLIFRSPQPAASNASDPVHALLERRGYAVERCVHGARRELHVARRGVRTLQKAA